MRAKYTEAQRNPFSCSYIGVEKSFVPVSPRRAFYGEKEVLSQVPVRRLTRASDRPRESRSRKALGQFPRATIRTESRWQQAQIECQIECCLARARGCAFIRNWAVPGR